MDATGSIIAGLSTRLKRTLGLSTESVIVQDGQQNQPRAVGGAGFATVVNRPRIDKNEFFKPGRCFRLRLRHANFSSDGKYLLVFRVYYEIPVVIDSVNLKMRQIARFLSNMILDEMSSAKCHLLFGFFFL